MCTHTKVGSKETDEQSECLYPLKTILFVQDTLTYVFIYIYAHIFIVVVVVV